MLRRGRGNRGLDLDGLSRRRGFSFGDWSILEEVVTQRSFEIGDKLAHGFGLGHTEGSGCGVAYRLKFGDMAGMGFVRLELKIWVRGMSRGMFDWRFGFMRNRPRKEVLAQGRLKIGNELLKDAGCWRDGSLDYGRLGHRRFNYSRLGL